MSLDSSSRTGHFARVAALEAAGQSFVTATVVLRRAPVSSHLGDRAIIHEGGRMEGFVGGACSREIVRKQALLALERGEPRLVMIRPDASEFPGPGVSETEVVVPMTCASEGSVNVYLEPHLPAQTLLVVGLTPVAEMVARLAEAMGERVRRVVSEEERRDLDPGAEGLTLEELGPALAALPAPALERVAAVVASQGHYDELALEALLRAGVRSVSLLASRRRAASVLELLHLQGLTPEQTARVRAPAGLDLGARTPGEVAVSILAGLIEERRGGRRDVEARGVGSSPPPPVETPRGSELAVSGSENDSEFAVSPVDGERVRIAGALHFADHEGTRYYFSCPNCKRRFLKDPGRYLTAPQPGT
ncbi:XdhC family protein [Deinococcus planocerae]|uniref:XdhC family protein n=1 Tax=Deinococcus planocerae TaxID=1737569 RepID=UPI000C7EAC9E|nr:XdhC family protein [Deinococcus planocerae]